MKYSPASRLQVNRNDFSSLLWILKSARQSGSVRIELQAVDEAQMEVPWWAHLLLVDGNVTACYLYRKADGQRMLAGKSAMLWLRGLGQRELLWSLESSAPTQQRLASLHTPTDLLASSAPNPNGQTGLHAATHPLSDPCPAPPLQGRSPTTANPLSVLHLLPSPQSSSRSRTEPHSEPGLLMDPLAQMEPHTTTNPSLATSLSPSSQTGPHSIIDPPSDPGFSINYRTESRTTTNSLSEQYPNGSQRTPPQRPAVLQPGSSKPVNHPTSSALLNQVPYRIAPIDQRMDTWSRRHRQVFVLIDGTKSVAQIADILGLSSVTIELIVTDLLSWGVVLCI